jgi:hypothetical protein
MLRRVAIVRNDVSGNRIAFIISVTTIGKLGTTLAVTSNRSTLQSNTMYYQVFLRCMFRLLVTAKVPSLYILVTLMMDAMCFSESSIPTRATRRNIPEKVMLHSYRYFISQTFTSS